MPEAHPKPYNLAWLERTNNISVDRRVLVSFSIGTNYADMWCDVVPMDACYLLLGRPWQFDRGAIHDGRQNSYSFEFSGCPVQASPIEFQNIQILPVTRRFCC